MYLVTEKVGCLIECIPTDKEPIPPSTLPAKPLYTIQQYSPGVREAARDAATDDDDDDDAEDEEGAEDEEVPAQQVETLSDYIDRVGELDDSETVTVKYKSSYIKIIHKFISDIGLQFNFPDAPLAADFKIDYSKLKLIMDLCKYDKHIGYVNYELQGEVMEADKKRLNDDVTIATMQEELSENATTMVEMEEEKKTLVANMEEMERVNATLKVEITTHLDARGEMEAENSAYLATIQRLEAQNSEHLANIKAMQDALSAILEVGVGVIQDASEKGALIDLHRKKEQRKKKKGYQQLNVWENHANLGAISSHLEGLVAAVNVEETEEEDQLGLQYIRGPFDKLVDIKNELLDLDIEGSSDIVTITTRYQVIRTYQTKDGVKKSVYDPVRQGKFRFYKKDLPDNIHAHHREMTGVIKGLLGKYPLEWDPEEGEKPLIDVSIVEKINQVIDKLHKFMNP
jgi:hypothetical protein